MFSNFSVPRVDVRNIKHIENFYEFESSRGYAWKQDLNRLRKMHLRISLQFLL